ncbi:rod shape-determining protein MreD [Streptomyces sp. JH002]|jgi:rod shape-determining protein MreD|uniref:Rod shape-determining protein n=1 Tax=Streptomyces xiamenensis TaxID=408015 RepID=A0A0F7FTA7_9ACTN|nr:MULTISPECIES: rod shape-determining protein MreD [Streptomyces]AKG42928.1 rod shape-determining protein [Streptomyces xiamenensis]MCU4745569.1 rod shape-determining protein MreD [Streptomyces sp. G-5]QQN79432.1 rod shape-determining protein MreD [Streptomyces sp. XC 2026]
MRVSRTILAVILVVVALVLQVTILARLQLPGAVPDLLLLTVLGLALVYGHVGGALVGFGAGLLADLAPPADHAVGRYALVLCVIGYAAGLTKPETGQHRSATVPMLVVAGGALSSTLLYAGVGALVGDTAARHVGLTGLLLTATLYDLLLAPFTVPLVMAMARRLENDPLKGDGSGGPSSGGDNLSGWFGGGTGLSTRGGGRRTRYGKAARIGGQRSTLLSRSARNRAGRIKGVKRL